MARIVKTAANTIERLGLGCQADLMGLFEPGDLTQEGRNLLTLFVNHGFAASLGSPTFLATHMRMPEALTPLKDELTAMTSRFLSQGYLLQLDKISPLLADFVIDAYLSLHSASELGRFCASQKKTPKSKSSAPASSSPDSSLAARAPASAAANSFDCALLLPACECRARLAISVLPNSALPPDVVRRLFLFHPSGGFLGEPRDYSTAGRAEFVARYLTQSDQLLAAVCSHPQFDSNELAWLHSAEASVFFQEFIFAPLWSYGSRGQNVIQHPSLAPLWAALGLANIPASRFGTACCEGLFAQAEAAIIKGSSSEDTSKPRSTRL